MAHEPVEEHAGADAPAEAPKRKGGIFRLIKAVAFVSVIVVVQIVGASMLAPSAQDTAKLAKDLAAAASGQSTEAHDEHGQESGGHGGHEAKGHGGHGGHDKNIKEVDLGSYNITRYNPTTKTTLAIDFELYGTVLADEATEFEHHFESSNARIKEQITLTMHSAESADLTDAGLGLIKRQLLEKTNRALGEPMLKEVLFSKFNFVER